ncbi:transcriptional regulator, LysR family [Oceanospirillum multiglobuliferum]|uniref:LysR family transcriptional regulator n=1 Tax=Oceanospirillum multiglobuliferum TaxID=64969 RepID=A0A1T4LI30_9GAMM|nr:LysR family transcriptional regulator [Oceanospirillum multiglobuliferum]OPX56652.1 LysR family transcriptional regulator [Oceanospirillum multiglobuliferum]SJZ54360.1 transcriptional regulator, LysR family [Oceanospirillum multiglobuliferum]
MPVDLESIKVLAAVVSAGSFAKAAEKLNKTQSSVSYQIQKLEQRLGTEVFDRSAYRAELTPVGERILAEGQRLLNQAKHLSSLVDQFSEGWEPRLELVVDGMLPSLPLLAALKEMADLNIPTHIQLRVEYLGGVQQRFEQDNADLMLALEYQADNRLSVQALADLKTVLVVAATHPLAQMRAIELAQLQHHIELTVHDSSYNKAYGGRQTFGGERVFYLSDFRAKLEALNLGLGFGWMPMVMVQHLLDSGELVELDYLGGSRHRYTPVLVNRLDRPLGRAGLLLSEKIRQCF